MPREIRRLAAIVAADVAGYSHLIGHDEEGTLRGLRGHRAELIDPAIQDYGGRIANTAGDSLLLEFPSAVDALRCAIAIQEGLVERNADIDVERQINFRIGLNVGDVIAQGDDILRDDVNIAARLQEIGEAGGIMLSDAAYRQIRVRVAVEYIEDGSRELKNIAEPVRVWRLATLVQNMPAHPPAVATAPPLPNKPSIAVLPFDNMSDGEQEFFVDGIVEDILTTLSKIEHLFVISRHSSFSYKGRSVDIRDVGRELGVRHVVEGSVRKSGGRVRVSAQLVDCHDGRQLWADRFDGKVDDVFELQDKITEDIVTALEIKLTEGEQVRIWRRRSGSPATYEHLQKARTLFIDFPRDANRRAIAEADQAIAINPQYWEAWCILGYAHNMAARFGWSDDPKASVQRAQVCVDTVLSSDPLVVDAHSLAGGIALAKHDYDAALKSGQRAVELGPNNADCHHVFTMTQCFSGNHRAAVDLQLQALRLNPLSPTNSLVELGRAYCHLRRFDEAQSVLRDIIARQPRWLAAHTLLLAVRVRLDDGAAARDQLEAVLAINPKFSISRYARLLPYRNDGDLNDFTAALRMGGALE